MPSHLPGSFASIPLFGISTLALALKSLKHSHPLALLLVLVLVLVQVVQVLVLASHDRLFGLLSCYGLLMWVLFR